jgi:hypothetical protein
VNPDHQLALDWIVGPDGTRLNGRLTVVQSQASLTLVAILSMAVEAVLRKNGANIATKVYFGWLSRCQACPSQGKKPKPAAQLNAQPALVHGSRMPSHFLLKKPYPAQRN